MPRLLGRWAGSGGRPLVGTGSPRRRGAAELRVEHGGGAEVGAGRGVTDRESSDHAKAPERSLQHRKNAVNKWSLRMRTIDLHFYIVTLVNEPHSCFKLIFYLIIIQVTCEGTIILCLNYFNF